MNKIETVRLKFFNCFQNSQEIAVAIKTYKVEPEKEQEDATRSEKFLEEACKLHVPFFLPFRW